MVEHEARQFCKDCNLMKKLISVFESKRSLLGICLLGSLVFTTYSIQENSNTIKKLSNFESGIQTCFTRVNQTYMANLLGDTASVYLTQNFQNLTEECLAEGILTAENSFQDKMTGALKQLSHLASNVHWFHEDILAPTSGKTLSGTTEVRDVNSRFEKIETTKDQILETVTQDKASVSRSLNNQKNMFFVSATLLVVLMIFEFLQNTKRKLSNNARESEAAAELQNNGGVTSVKVGEIVRLALEQNDLVNCSRLFANYHAYASSEKGKNKLSLDNFVAPNAVKANNYKNKTIDQLWEDDNAAVAVDSSAKEVMKTAQLKSLNLEQMCSQVVDLLTDKLFSQGVKLDLHIADSIFIKANTEELEQVLYHLFSYSINSISSKNGEKLISVYAHRLGDVVAFDLIHSGNGFDEATLKQRAGLNVIGGELDLELKICQSLLDELQAKVQLDNKIDQHGNQVGGRVKIIFKSGEATTTAAMETKKMANTEKVSSTQLVDLKIGTKKEILAAFEASSAREI